MIGLNVNKNKRIVCSKAKKCRNFYVFLSMVELKQRKPWTCVNISKTLEYYSINVLIAVAITNKFEIQWQK